MSEPFVKLHTWMASELGLSGNELIIFAVIHSYTEYKGGYNGGASQLGKWAGVSRQNAYRYLAPLIEKGLVVKKQGSGGRKTAVYASTVNRLNMRQLKSMSDDPTVSIWDAQPSQVETLIDNIDDYIDISNIDARARDEDELDNIITAAHVTMHKPEDETVEAEIEQRIRELWNMGDRSIYGEAVNNADLRELIRKLDQNKMLTVWWSIRKAEARYMTATDKDQRREYFYSVIYNELKGR